MSLLYLLLIPIFLFLLFLLFVAYRLVTPKRMVGQWTPRDFGADYQDVELKTEDGITIRGWLIPAGKDCVILLHGYSVSRWDQVYMRVMMEEMWKRGYSVLAFDFRAHGKSGGKHTTIGDKEFLDLKAIHRFSERRCQRVYVVGYSMGGFLALKAAAEGMCHKAVADSPFIYVDRTGARGLKYFANLPSWLYYLVKPLALLISEANYENADPFKFAKNIKVPVLIIAGREDPLVKVEEVQEFVNMAGNNVELWVTDAPHVRTVKVRKEEYIERILSFLS